MRIGLLIFAAALLALLALRVGGEVQRWIGVRSYPPTLIVSFSNLPPAWAIMTSTDLTNWISVMKSGDLPPQEIEFAITNAGHGQYFRVTALTP